MIKGRTFPEVKVTTVVKKNGCVGGPKELYKKTDSKTKLDSTKTKKKDEVSVSEIIAQKLNKKYSKKD